MTQSRRSILSAPRRLVRLGSAAAIAALTTAAASSAWAGGGDSAFRLSADIPVGGFEHFIISAGPFTTDDTIGVFGITEAPFQVGVGYLFRKNIYVGGRFGFQGQFVDGRDRFQGRFEGRFEYIFNGDKVRPFVGANLGFGGTDPGFGDVDPFLFVSGTGGAHIFLADSFSLSPYGELGVTRDLDVDYTSIYFVVGVSFVGWMWQ